MNRFWTCALLLTLGALGACVDDVKQRPPSKMAGVSFDIEQLELVPEQKEQIKLVIDGDAPSSWEDFTLSVTDGSVVSTSQLVEEGTLILEINARTTGSTDVTVTPKNSGQGARLSVRVWPYDGLRIDAMRSNVLVGETTEVRVVPTAQGVDVEWVDDERPMVEFGSPGVFSRQDIEGELNTGFQLRGEEWGTSVMSASFTQGERVLRVERMFRVIKPLQGLIFPLNGVHARVGEEAFVELKPFDEDGTLLDSEVINDLCDEVKVSGTSRATTVGEVEDGVFSISSTEATRRWLRVRCLRGTDETTLTVRGLFIADAGTSIDVGDTHSCATTSSPEGASARKCWGSNALGQLGDASLEFGQVYGQPQSVALNPSDTDVAQADSGGQGQCVVTAKGKLSCVGLYAQDTDGVSALLDEDNLKAWSEIVHPQGKEWMRVAVGEQHACAIDEQLDLFCFGRDDRGQLGDGGDNVASKEPVLVDSTQKWIDAFVSTNRTCALDTERALWCWGDNDQGIFNEGGASTLTTPLLVETFGKRVLEADIASAFMCYLNSLDEIICQRRGISSAASNAFQNLTTEDSPVGWSSVRVQYGVACALSTRGKAYCVGSNQHAMVGATDNMGKVLATRGSVYALSPLDVSGTVTRMDIGPEHGCLTTGDDVRCWGDSTFGRLGNGAVGLSGADGLEQIVSDGITIDPPKEVESLALSDEYGCVIVGDGIQCFGVNISLRLGMPNPPTSYAAKPSPAAPAPSGVTAAPSTLYLGPTHACVRQDRTIPESSSNVYCWGDNTSCELGKKSEDGKCNMFSAEPMVLDRRWESLSLGTGFTCGIDEADDVYCWGNNVQDQLSTNERPMDGGEAASASPKRVVDGDNRNISGTFTHIASTDSGTCATNSEGASGGGGPELFCWGRYIPGIGDNRRAVVVHTFDQSTTVLQIESGIEHFCALTALGSPPGPQTTQVRCWGGNKRGQSDPTAPSSVLPFTNGAPSFIDLSPSVPAPTEEFDGRRLIATGGQHSCAVVEREGTPMGKLNVVCWGDNSFRQGGVASVSVSPAPRFVALDDLDDTQYAVEVVAGTYQTCAVIVRGENAAPSGVRCWGRTTHGQMGIGDQIDDSIGIYPTPLSVSVAP